MKVYEHAENQAAPQKRPEREALEALEGSLGSYYWAQNA